MTDKVMMKCGHSNNATCGNKPACAICDCIEIAEDKPSLEGRKAICTGHKRDEIKSVDSNWDLAFFKHCPDKESDEYYCGCYGWD